MAKRKSNKKSNNLITGLTIIFFIGISLFVGGGYDTNKSVTDNIYNVVDKVTGNNTSESKLTSQTTDGLLTAEDIKDYDGTKNVVINNNESGIESPESFKTELNGNFYVSQLDNQNRAGVAKAYLTKSTYRSSADRDENSDISNIKPTGWKNKKVDGSYIYNRSHLIGYSLIDADTDTVYNLITGTRDFNADTDWGMLHYENLVRDAVLDGKDVMYIVNPVFKGNEEVVRGVQMIAESTDGSLKFNVFIYNVQDNITINYSDGTSVKS